MSLTLPFRLQDWLGRLAFRLQKGGDTIAPVEERRAQMPAGWMLGKRPAGAPSENRVVPGRSGSPDVPVRIYSPLKPSGRGLVYIHGGGFYVGGLDACHHICAELAELTGDVIVSVDYRLAPEDPFPAGLDDCEDVLRWTFAHAAALGIDPTRIAVGGDSAGGNLSAALCLRLKAASDLTVTRQVLIYPMLDLTCSRESWVSEAAPYLTRERAAGAVHMYFGEHDVRSAEVSPLFADDLSGLPPALVMTAQHDTLRDDGRDYAAALERAGVRTVYIEHARMPHGFLSQPRLTKHYDRALNEVADFLRE